MDVKIRNKKLKYHSPKYLHREKRDKKNRIDYRKLSEIDRQGYGLIGFEVCFREIDCFDPVHEVPTHDRYHNRTYIVDKYE